MSKYNIGDKVSATVKEKSKTTYHFYGGIQYDDLCDWETRIIHPAFNIVGVITTRKKNRPGCTKQIKCVQTADGKMYRLDRLTNIQHI
jgi:hypothetical protein